MEGDLYAVIPQKTLLSVKDRMKTEIEDVSDVYKRQAVVGVMEGKKEFREKTANRIEVYQKYIASKRQEIEECCPDFPLPVHRSEPLSTLPPF